MDYLAVIFRWAHVIAAILAGGAIWFNRLALLPALAGVSEETRKTVLDNVRARWAKWVHIAILLLLVSGFYNFITGPIKSNPPVEQYKGLYHALIGLKMLMAFGVFFLASLLAGRSEAAQRYRQKGAMWTSVCAVLVLLIVCLSGVLSKIPRQIAEPSAPAASSGPAVATDDVK